MLWWSKEENGMIYGLLVLFTVLLHLAWILFLIFGVFLVLKWHRFAWFHLGGLLFSLILNVFGWYCPLTYLENDLRYLQDVESTYSGPFIVEYLERIIYPDLPAFYIRAAEIVFVLLYMVLYVYLARKHHVYERIRKKTVNG